MPILLLYFVTFGVLWPYKNNWNEINNNSIKFACSVKFIVTVSVLFCFISSHLVDYDKVQIYCIFFCFISSYITTMNKSTKTKFNTISLAWCQFYSPYFVTFGGLWQVINLLSSFLIYFVIFDLLWQWINLLKRKRHCTFIYIIAPQEILLPGKAWCY